MKVNEDAAHCVPLHPLYRNTGLSVKQLYSDVRIQRNDPSKPGGSGEVINDHADLFTKDGEPVGNVYMLGQPGRGKTTFCLHLLTLWCAAMTVIPSTALSVWKFGQNCFHFVFYVSLRHVNRCRSRIEDMICDMFARYDDMREVILSILRNQKYRCLIMVDGLDEWVISQEVAKELTNLNLKGLPDTGRLSMNCTILFASRHWKLDLIKPIYKAKDIEVEILGLTEKGITSIIENILKNQSKLEIGSGDYNSKLNKLKVQVEKSKSSVDVPMFVTMTAFLGLHGDYVQESDTGLFFDQVVLLIRRAIDDGRISKDAADGLHITHGSSIAIPKVIKAIQQNKILSKFIVVLYKLGKVAFNGLIESNLVFDQDTLEEEDVLGKHELEIALKVGIVSQMTAPGFFLVPKVSIEFLHKSMQEAMAALYIVCNKTDAFTSLCEYCCTVDKVIEMSNVLQYIAGISPEISCTFSKHITQKATKDQGIAMNWTELFIGRSMMLYNMQKKCYNELCHTLSLTKESHPSPQYHVADVVLRYDDGKDKVRLTCDIMSGCPDSILSFAMLVSGMHTSWSAVPVLQKLPQCSHLTTLQVQYDHTTPDPELVSVIPTLTHLQRVAYYHAHGAGEDCDDVDSRVVRAILQLPRLRHVKLVYVALDDDTLVMTDHMTELQKVELDEVRMSPVAWNRFVDSLLSVKYAVEITVCHKGSDGHLNTRIVRAILQIPQLKHVTLRDVNLDDDTLVLTEHMTGLQKVELKRVRMSPVAWNRFVSSLRTVKHAVDVTIKMCEIDVDTRNMISKSEHLKVTNNWERWMGGE